MGEFLAATDADYRKYIQSEQWREFRRGYFRRHPKRCRVCDTTRRIELHHLSYWRLGRETDDQVAPLCEGCHEEVHDRMRRRMTGDIIAKMREQGFRPFVKPDPPKAKKAKKKKRPKRAVAERPPWKVVPNSTPTEWVVDFGAL